MLRQNLKKNKNKLFTSILIHFKQGLHNPSNNFPSLYSEIMKQTYKLFWSIYYHQE